MTTTAPATFDEIALQLDYAGEMYSVETAQVEWANKVDGLTNWIWWLRNAGGTAEQVQEATNRLRQVERQGPRPVRVHHAEVERAAEHGANNSISN